MDVKLGNQLNKNNWRITMTQRTPSDKLLDICERSGEKIAERWYLEITKHNRTPAFQNIPKEQCLQFATDFNKKMNRMYFAKYPYQEISRFIENSGFTKEAYARNIPLSDVIYSLILLRRHIWLFLGSQVIDYISMFSEYETKDNSSIDIYKTVGSVNRVVLIFDYAIHIATKEYEELNKKK
jgi:hypothetical protein